MFHALVVFGVVFVCCGSALTLGAMVGDWVRDLVTRFRARRDRRRVK